MLGKEVTLMTKSLTIDNLKIGEGIPKICVSITGRNVSEVLKQVDNIMVKEPDLIEWRVDFFDDVEDLSSVADTLRLIKERIRKIPLIFTFRTSREGGEREITVAEYVNLNKQMAANELTDLLDVEIFTCQDRAKELIAAIHDAGKLVIASNHDFEKTPSEVELIAILKKMEALNADILKLAVMPNDSEDVKVLLQTTAKMKVMTDKLLITMSMGSLGAISRIVGQQYGSSVTFASIGQASAPGQIEIDELRKLLDS